MIYGITRFIYQNKYVSHMIQKLDLMYNYIKLLNLLHSIQKIAYVIYRCSAVCIVYIQQKCINGDKAKVFTCRQQSERKLSSHCNATFLYKCGPECPFESSKCTDEDNGQLLRRKKNYRDNYL